MFASGTVIRFTPDQQGRGGIKSGLHSFGQKAIMDVRDSSNVMVKLRHWEKCPSSIALTTEFPTDPAAVSGGVTGGRAYLGTPVLHPYYLYDITDPSRFSVARLLSQEYDSGTGDNTGEHVFDHTAAIAGTIYHTGTNTGAPTFTAFATNQTGSVHVWIDSVAGPDTFAWREPLGNIHAGVAITAGVDQTLSFTGGSLKVNFASDTGHVLNDRWIIGTPYVRRITNNGKFHDAEFVNIGQRCFFASGFEEAQIYSWATGIPEVYELGAPEPTVPLTYTLNPSTVSGPGYITFGSPYITYPDLTSSLRYVKANDNVHISSNFSLPPPGPVAWDAVAQADATNIEFVSVIGETQAKWGLAPGGQYVRGPSQPATPAYPATAANQIIVNRVLDDDQRFAGLTILISGVARTINYTQVTTETPTNTLLDLSAAPAGMVLLATFDINGTRVLLDKPAGYDAGATQYLLAVTITNPDTGTRISWADQGPIYSYAWYDYETGHVSNMAPLMYVTEKNQTNVSIILHFTTAMNPPIYDQARFKHLIIFRNVLGGGGTALFPIGLLPTSAAIGGAVALPLAAPYDLTDIRPDSDLILSGALLGPRFTNGRPTVTLPDGTIETSTPAHIGHWDGRCFLAPVQDPGLIQFSADAGQVTFGVPTESFPGTNFLRIPADDGAVTGFKLIGSAFVVLTRRWAYYIAGNNETNYRLLRYSTTMPMVGPYQIAEMPSQMEEQASSIVYFHPDGRLYAYSPGQQPQWLSEEVDDIVSSVYDGSLVAYLMARVHVVSSAQRRGLLLFLYSSDGTKSTLLYRDFETQTWSELVVTSGSFTTVYSAVGQGGLTSATSVRELVGFGGAITQILPGTPVTYKSTVSLSTFPVYPDDPKRMRQIDYVRLYVANAASGTNVWTVNIYPDETSKVIVAPAALTAEALPFSIFSQAVAGHPFPPVDGATVTELVAYPTSGTRTYDTTVTPGAAVDAPVVGHRFVIEIVWPPTTTQQFLYAFDVALSDVSDQGLPVG